MSDPTDDTSTNAPAKKDSRTKMEKIRESHDHNLKMMGKIKKYIKAS